MVVVEADVEPTSVGDVLAKSDQERRRLAREEKEAREEMSR